jgi:N-acetyl sugar amidotransferase
MPRYCQSCILPETRPGVLLDAAGICNGCHNVRGKAEIDWRQRGEAFRELVARAKARGRDYDCVIPVSGGKDSYWQVVTCLEYGLRPLCVTYVCPGRTRLGVANLRGLTELGVDLIEVRVNPEVERRFIEKSFRRTAISGLVTHMGIFSAPINIATRFEIPLVIYGENSAFEYGSEDESLVGARLDRKWLESFGVTAGTVAEDWIGDDLSREDLSIYSLASDEVLESRGIHVTFLGWYFRWDPENSYRVASTHGFRARSEGARTGHLDYVNIDDDFIAIHHHAKWHKFGITRSWDTLSIEIRMGRMRRAEAIARLREQGDETPREDIGLFCDYLRISARDYFELLERFRNAEIWSRPDGRWEIEDFLIPDFPWADDPIGG